ncbi:MAG TPA: hypothetical protein VGC66_23245 [Pyrinomonadaceae bacterium]|jgi:hypothetical protein
MSTPIVTDSDSVAPGQIKFYDAIQPPLPSGNYVFHAEQQVTDPKGGKQYPYSSDQSFNVDGPRFQIDPSTIHMVFPPANQEGDYYDVLPNIVFKDFALPWSRKIDPLAQESLDAPPWMGILTIYDTEMPLSPGQTPVEGQSPQLSTPTTVSISEVVHPSDATVLGPSLPDADTSSGEKVLVVDINLPFFQAIAPKLSELGLLAHARAVNTDGKVMLGMNEDGCFSVVVGNRVAKRGATNTVFLLSFEGHQDHLPGGGTIPSQYQKIRLVVLGSWRFYARDTPGSFIYLMSRLCRQGGVKLLQLPKAAATDKEPTAKEALEIGFVPLQNDMRVGEKTTSWYRGPLTPAPTKPDLAYGPYRYSDHAMHYDPDTGMLNLGYAAAWQIGRLLALSDGNFARSLFNWRRQYFRTQRQTSDQQQVESRVAPALAMTEEAEPTGAGVTTMMRNFMATKVVRLRAEFPKIIPRGQPPLEHPAPGILSQDEVADLWSVGLDPVQALRRKLKEAVKL